MNTRLLFRMMLVGMAGLALISSLMSVAPAGAATPVVPQVAAGELSAAEKDGLIYMREEEKLAHDVYQALYDKWGLPNFRNIASSETTHMGEIKLLLDRYGVADPAAGKAAGVFANSDLQALYDQMIKQGTQSLADALRTGATIEEVDITDLQKRTAQIDNADIQWVYGNLLRGSGNHLRAFVSNLSRRAGDTYAPQYLSQDDFNKIISEPMGRGRGSSS
jgi:hypothetical protein